MLNEQDGRSQATAHIM